MKIFASGFTFRLNELGVDGYAVDSDLVMNELAKFTTRSSGNVIYEHTLPEYIAAIERYHNDLYVMKWSIPKKDFEYIKGDRKLVPSGGILEDVFDRLYIDHGYELMATTKHLYDEWAKAHANAIINRLYDLNLPTIEDFLLLNNGAINEAIEWIYGGRYDADADNHFAIALQSESRRLNRNLSKFEIDRLRCQFYITNEETMLRYKEQFVDEVRNEWVNFLKHGIYEVIM